MRAKSLTLLAILAAALVIPAIAFGQTAAERARLDTELRMREAQQNLRNLPAQQLQDQTNRAAADLDIRLRTQQNIANSAPSQPTYYPTDLIPSTPLTSMGGIDLAAQTEMQNKELSAQNARLRALAK